DGISTQNCHFIPRAVYLVNGRVGRTQSPLAEDPFAEPNQLFRGMENGRFEEIMPQGGTADSFIENSRAAAFGDYDGDGDIDILVVNNGGRARLLKNVVGDRGRWIMFRVINRHNLDAIGAMVRVTVSGKNHWRPVQRAYSYLSSNDPRVHFGLSEADSVERVVVIWPGGKRESFGPFPAGAVHELRQGAGVVERMKDEG
ncbi:MAG: ASPIC/UnbV domain-containing protein, partial [Blastocatellia bacterium]|nr:ASPIC/UnbV domain-containing protein [Blastocatellia bacterium]